LLLVSEPAHVDAVLLTGTIGSGKTALAVELGELLGGRGHATAVIDLDWLGWFHPGAGGSPSPSDLIVRNLESVWPSFRSAGARYLVMARMIETAAEVERIGAALGGIPVTVVRVVASRDVIEARLRARDTGAELEGHLRELAAMDERLDALAVEDWTIDNGGRPIEAVAIDLVDRLGWA
jgi:hypothetical protein